MRTIALGCRPFDEKIEFEKCKSEFGIDIETHREALCRDNAHLAEGFDCVSVLTQPVDREIIEMLSSVGVRMLGTRTVGYDHIDLEAARCCGMKVFHSAYSPDSVAEFTLMLMLMCLRKLRSILSRSSINDFSLKGLNGSVLGGKTVGIVGTGAIGRRVIALLAGFGCRILAYDKYPTEIEGVSFVSPEEVFRRSDVISLHAPLNEASRHMIDGNAINMMKNGAVIINTSRGALIDTPALIQGLKSGKIGACALDVLEEENGVFYHDLRNHIHGNEALSVLRDMPNVIVTPHIAFYTDSSVRDMVRNCILGFLLESRGEENPFRIL